MTTNLKQRFPFFWSTTIICHLPQRRKFRSSLENASWIQVLKGCSFGISSRLLPIAKAEILQQASSYHLISNTYFLHMWERRLERVRQTVVNFHATVDFVMAWTFQLRVAEDMCSFCEGVYASYFCHYNMWVCSCVWRHIPPPVCVCMCVWFCMIVFVCEIVNVCVCMCVMEKRGNKMFFFNLLVPVIALTSNYR